MIKPTQQEENRDRDDGKLLYSSGGPLGFGERLARNMALAAMLVLAVTAVKNAELPSGATVLTAVREIIDMDWDGRLGKISFVSNLLPETVAVFFESPVHEEWTAPCFGAVSHAWTESEPYLGYSGGDGRVFSIGTGQVMSLSHGLGEERVIRVRQEDGMEVMYYNLASAFVGEGDAVTPQTCLGQALPEGVAVEVRRAGRAIDPTASISPRAGEDGQ